MAKPTEPCSRDTTVEDTTLGWRLVNPVMKARYGIRVGVGQGVATILERA